MKSDLSKTQPLPVMWRQSYGQFQPEPRRRYARTTASMAVTTQLPVIVEGK